MNKKPNIAFSGLATAALFFFAGESLAQPQTPPPSVVSPEIAANGDVTLRVRAPQAEKVELVSGGDIPVIPFGAGLAMSKGAGGVWQVTLDNLDSGAYRYRFSVDAVPTSDPSNPSVSQSNGNAWSLFYVAGAAFMDSQRVAHGAVAEVHYYSAALA